jgi:excisionase family DNA binding protein
MQLPEDMRSCAGTQSFLPEVWADIAAMNSSEVPDMSLSGEAWSRVWSQVNLQQAIVMSESQDLLETREEWLPLSKAAALLGVHSMTLRRWSDSGRFPSYRTAGGHRRFAVSDIEAYIARQKSDLDSELTADWASNALVHTRQQISHHRGHRWLEAIEAEDLQDEYRQLGHRLMGLLLQHVAAEKPDDSFVEEADRIGRRYGVFGRQAGLTLTSILEATLFFRDVLIESTLDVRPSGYVEKGTSLRILRRVNEIINAVQLAVTAYYENGG